MQERIELRIDERKASRYLPEDLGERLEHSVRKVVMNSTDPRLDSIRVADKEQKSLGSCLFTGWSITRKYTNSELNAARLFTLVVKRWFEPEGEACGTSYDDSSACPCCGAGAPMTTPLRLDSRSLPKNGDIAKTIADELIVSRRFVDLFRSEGLVGAAFDPIQLSNKKNTPSSDWFQPKIVCTRPSIAGPTRFGETPFDDNEYGKCPARDTLGLNRLSEVWIDSTTYDGADLTETQQYAGHREGILRPATILLVSPRLRELLKKQGLKQFGIEIAHLL